MKNLKEMYEMLEGIIQMKREWRKACKDNLEGGKTFQMVVDDDEQRLYDGLPVSIVDKHGYEIQIVVDKIRGKKEVAEYSYGAEVHIVTWDCDTFNGWVSLDNFTSDAVDYILENVDWDDEVTEQG